jgi:hypothetical protein
MLLKSPATSMGMSALQEKEKQQHTRKQPEATSQHAVVWSGHAMAAPNLAPS